MKKCPYCAEEIQDAAIVCKHCHKDLVAPSSVTPPATTVIVAKPPPGALTRIVTLLVYALFGFGALAVLMMLNSPSTPAKASKTLGVDLGWSAIALQVTNRSAPAGTSATVYINGTPPFTYRADVSLPEPGKSVTISLREFVTKSGDRFNPIEKAVTEAWIGGDGYDYEKYGK